MDIPGHSKAAIKLIEASYKKFMPEGNEASAKKYLLTVPDDKIVYSSIQYYTDNTLNVCLETTFHFVDKVIDEISKLNEAARQPLAIYHIGADETSWCLAWVLQCKEFLANNVQGVTYFD